MLSFEHCFVGIRQFVVGSEGTKTDLDVSIPLVV